LLRLREYGALMECCWQRKTEILGEKTVPVPLCLPQIWHYLARDRTRTFAMRGPKAVKPVI
jgi:hypothetical protein